MALLSTLARAMPVEVQIPNAIPWEALIVSVFDFVVIYGWRIIVFTLLLKLLLSPLDFVSRYTMRKNARLLEGVKDKLEALDKQFSDPLEKMRARSAITKKAGVKNALACLPLLVTPIIFIWMATSMQSVAKYMNVQNYIEWYNVYEASLAQSALDPEINDPNLNIEENPIALQIAQEAVTEYYDANDGNDSFLWIKSIWSSDVPWQKPIKTSKDFRNAIGKYRDQPQKFYEVFDNVDQDGNRIDEEGNLILDDDGNPIPQKVKLTAAQLNDILARYDKVTGDLRNSSSNGANGYLILVILAAVVSFFSFRVMQKQQRASGMSMMGMGTFGQNSNKINMKIMQFIMPAMYIVFGLLQTAIFSIYMIASSLMTLGLISLMMFILNILDKKRVHDEVTTIHKYGRPDPKELIEKDFDK